MNNYEQDIDFGGRPGVDGVSLAQPCICSQDDVIRSSNSQCSAKIGEISDLSYICDEMGETEDDESRVSKKTLPSVINVRREARMTCGSFVRSKGVRINLHRR